MQKKFTPAGDRTRSRLQRSPRHARAFGARSRRCAPAAGAAPAEYAKITILALKTPAPSSRPQRRRGFFDIARKMSTLKKKRLGIVAPNSCGHLVYYRPMNFCLRDPKNEKKPDFTSADFSFLSAPAAPNHKNTPEIRYKHF